MKKNRLINAFTVYVIIIYYNKYYYQPMELYWKVLPFSFYVSSHKCLYI